MPRPTAIEPLHSMRRFDVGMDVNGLVKVELPILAPTQSMNHMVRVLGSKAGQDNPLLIRLPIAIGIFEMKQFGALADIGTAIPWDDSRWYEQPIGEYSRFFRVSIAIGIFENQYFVIGRLARLNLWIDGGT